MCIGSVFANCYVALLLPKVFDGLSKPLLVAVAVELSLARDLRRNLPKKNNHDLRNSLKKSPQIAPRQQVATFYRRSKLSFSRLSSLQASYLY